MEILAKTMKPRKLSKRKQQRTKFIRQTSNKRTESDPKFSFNKMAFEIHKLLGESKVVVASFHDTKFLPTKNNSTEEIYYGNSMLD